MTNGWGCNYASYYTPYYAVPLIARSIRCDYLQPVVLNSFHSVAYFALWISCIHLLWLSEASWSANEPDPKNSKQIVILYTHRTLTPVNADWDRGIRSSLSAELGEPLDIEIEYLNLVRHKDANYLRGWIELLKTKYSNKPPDLVLPVYGPAIEFTLDNRETIFPNVPIVFCSASPKLAELAHAQPNTTGVAFRLDIAGTVATARSLHPACKRIMILTGTSGPELALKRSVNEAILAMKTGMEIEFVEGLPRHQLLERVNAADRDTLMLMLSYDEDLELNNYVTVELLEQLSTTCSVPIYGLYDTLLGHGILGGNLGSAESQGKLAGGMAVRVLRGEKPQDIPVVGLDKVVPQFDYRQLRRWKISEASLPPGSRVLFDEPTFWDQFGRYLLLGLSAILLQSSIIFALVANRKRRMRAERESRDLAGKILTAQEDERRYLAREMHDDLTQRLAASANEAGILERRFHENSESRELLGSLKSKLITICDDVHRLARQIHPGILDDFGLQDALRNECECFGDRNGIKVEFHCGELPSNLPKEISLVLYRIVQEAMWNTAKYAKTDRITVDLNSDPEFIQLEVCDFGCGFDPAQESTRRGLGLASMNERARLVGGKFAIDSSPGHGVRIEVQIPLPEHSA